MQASACSGSPALAARVATLPPGVVGAGSSRASALRDDSMTLAPAAAYDAAIAAPIPRDAPVTTAVLPWRLTSVIGDLRVEAVGFGGSAARGAASWSTGRTEQRGVDDLERVADVDPGRGEEPGATRVPAGADRRPGLGDGLQLPGPDRSAELPLQGRILATGAAAQAAAGA